MKKIIFAMFSLVGTMMFVTSCQDTETYADQRDRENDSINTFIARKNIKVISEKEFKSRFQTGASVLTDTAKNEYVLFESSGVYMQILNQGHGDIFNNNGTKTILCRYNEYNLLSSASGNALYSSNNVLQNSHLYDKMYVTCSSGSYTAYFDGARSTMANTHRTTSVPSAWLAPLPYIKLGRYTAEKPAEVRLIVPHGQGTSTASSNVMPCYYEITYELGAQ